MTKKILPIIQILLLFIFVVSCKNKNVKKPQLQKELPTKTENKTADYDPYFIESNSINSTIGPASITRSILQDRNGNIWLATWEGIIQYDGKTFINHTNKNNLKRFHVFSILEDKAGNIWFGTIGAGVYLYDGKTFTNFNKKDGLVHNSIGCFYEDKTGKIWIGTMDGISVYNGSTFRNFTTKDGLTNNDVNTIIEDPTRKFWIGTRGEACYYQGTIFTNIINGEDKSFTNVRSIIEDAKGNIWLGGNDGLWRYNGSSFNKVAKNFVGYIYEDKKGNIWTSSESAESRGVWELLRYDEKMLGMITATSILKKQDMFFGIFEDKEEGIWLGTLNGVCRYNGNTFNYFK